MIKSKNDKTKYFLVLMFYIFGLRDHLNKLGRGPLGDATYKYQGFRPCGFRGDFFHVYSISACVKHVPKS